MIFITPEAVLRAVRSCGRYDPFEADELLLKGNLTINQMQDAYCLGLRDRETALQLPVWTPFNEMPWDTLLWLTRCTYREDGDYGPYRQMRAELKFAVRPHLEDQEKFARIQPYL